MSDDDNDGDFSEEMKRFMRVVCKKAMKQMNEPQHGFSIDVPAADLRQRLVAHAKVMREGVNAVRKLPTRDEVIARAAQSQTLEPWKNLPDFRPEEIKIIAVEMRIQFLIEYASFMTDMTKVYRIHTSEWTQLFDRYDLPLTQSGGIGIVGTGYHSIGTVE